MDDNIFSKNSERPTIIRRFAHLTMETSNSSQEEKRVSPPSKQQLPTNTLSVVNTEIDVMQKEISILSPDYIIRKFDVDRTYGPIDLLQSVVMISTIVVPLDYPEKK